MDDAREGVREALEQIVVREGDKVAGIDAVLRLSMSDLDRQVVMMMIQGVRLSGQVDGILMMMDSDDVQKIMRHVSAEADDIARRLRELVDLQIEAGEDGGAAEAEVD